MRHFVSAIGAVSALSLSLFVFASTLTACSSPPPESVHTTGLQSDVLSGCATKALSVTIPGLDPQVLKTCNDGSGTILGFTATIHVGDVVSFTAEPSLEVAAPTVASTLLVNDQTLATVSGTTVTAVQPGLVAVSGLGPSYCDEVVNPGALLSTSNPADVAGMTCLLVALEIKS